MQEIKKTIRSEDDYKLLIVNNAALELKAVSKGYDSSGISLDCRSAIEKVEFTLG